MPLKLRVPRVPRRPGATVLVCVVLLGLSLGAQTPKPDLLVSEVRWEKDRHVVVEFQNQGPGRGSGQFQAVVNVTSMHERTSSHSYTVTLPVPSEPFAIVQTQPLAILGDLKLDPQRFDVQVQVKVDPQERILDERRQNNEFWHQISVQPGVTQLELPRVKYRTSTKLPDLVVKDITYDGTYLVVTYANVGAGGTGADFAVKFSTPKASRESNTYYRYYLPPPGTTQRTGGMTIGLLDLKPGDTTEVTAEVDFEDRVRESNEANNRLTKVVRLVK